MDADEHTRIMKALQDPDHRYTNTSQRQDIVTVESVKAAHAEWQRAMDAQRVARLFWAIALSAAANIIIADKQSGKGTGRTMFKKHKYPNDYKSVFLTEGIPKASICRVDMHKSSDEETPWTRKILSMSCDEAGELLPPTLRPKGSYLKLYLTLTFQHTPRWTIKVSWPRSGNCIMYDSTHPPPRARLVDAFTLFKVRQSKLKAKP